MGVSSGPDFVPKVCFWEVWDLPAGHQQDFMKPRGKAGRRCRKWWVVLIHATDREVCLYLAAVLSVDLCCCRALPLPSIPDNCCISTCCSSTCKYHQFLINCTGEIPSGPLRFTAFGCVQWSSPSLVLARSVSLNCYVAVVLHSACKPSVPLNISSHPSRQPEWGEIGFCWCYWVSWKTLEKGVWNKLISLASCSFKYSQLLFSDGNFFISLSPGNGLSFYYFFL